MDRRTERQTKRESERVRERETETETETKTETETETIETETKTERERERELLPKELQAPPLCIQKASPMRLQRHGAKLHKAPAKLCDAYQ